MPLVNETERNHRTFKLRTPGASVTLSCSNMFAMHWKDRALIWELFDKLEQYEIEFDTGEGAES